MAYNSGIPTANQLLSQSQPQIQGNFQEIEKLIQNDHGDFSLGVGVEGQHNRVSFITSPASPPAANLPNSPSFLAGQVGLYSFLSPITNKNELYINKTNNSGVVQIPGTASILGTSNPVLLSAGWTYLPSGMILKWSANVTANGQTTITFPVAASIPVFNTCITVLVQIANGGAGDSDQAIILKGVSPATFNVYGSARTTTGAKSVTFTYLAIGY